MILPAGLSPASSPNYILQNALGSTPESPCLSFIYRLIRAVAKYGMKK